MKNGVINKIIGLILVLQGSFMSRINGQYEDILCHPCVLNAHNQDPNQFIYFSNECPNQVEITWGLFGDFKTIYLNELDCGGISNPYCEPQNSIVIFDPDNDTYPSCSTNHTNFQTYYGSLSQSTSVSSCQDYPKKEVFNLGESVRLYSHIRLNQDPLNFDLLMRVTYPNGSIREFYSYQGFDPNGNPLPSPIQGVAYDCWYLYWNITPDAAGTYYVDYILIYQDGTQNQYGSSTFTVNIPGPAIPTFTDVTPPSFNNITACDAQIGDIDNDGDMDFIMGQYLAVNNSGAFSLINFPNGSTVELGSLLDINKDGKLDYLSEPSGLVDFDNKGKVSLLNSLETSNLCVFYVGDCLIKDLDNDICILTRPTDTYQTLATDLNNDKVFDLILGDKVFTDIHNIFNQIGTLPFNISNSKAYDLNNDAMVDIVNCGFTGIDPIEIMLNDGSLFKLSNNTSGQIHIADINNDGHLDILNKGVYFKNGEQITFTFFNNFPGISSTANMFKPIDYDKDGDLDLLVIRHETSPKLFRNNSIVKNIKPNRPQNPTASVSSTNVDFNWTNGEDNNNLTKFPTYNLYVKNLTTNEIIYFPHADTLTGQLTLLEKGNCEYNTGWKLKNLPAGRYVWKVQAVDQGFMGSAWSVEREFEIKDPVCDTEVEMVQGTECILPKNKSTGQLLFVCNNLSGMQFDSNLGKRYKIGYSQYDCTSNCFEGTQVQIYCIEPLEDIKCNSPDDLVLAAPSIEAAQGSEVCIPVMVRHFRNMQSGKGSIKWDPTLLQYTEVKPPTSVGIPGFSGGFNATNAVNGEFKYLWANDTPALPLTLSDNTVIMELCFKVTGDTGKAAYVVFGQGTLATDWSNDNGPVPVCFEYGKVKIINQPPVCASFATPGAVTNVTCNGLSNGSVALAVTGINLGNHMIVWKIKSTGAVVKASAPVTSGTDLTGVPAGTYVYEISFNGTVCNTGEATVTQPSEFVIPTTGVVNNGACGQKGSIDISTTSGGNGGYTYTWNPSLGNTPNPVNLDPGSYSVTVTDSKGCTATTSMTINGSNSLNVGMQPIRQPTCRGNDGEIRLTPADTSLYRYTWSDAAVSSPNPKNLKADTTYSVTVTREADGCTAVVNNIQLSRFDPSVSIVTSGDKITCDKPDSIGFMLVLSNKDQYNNVYDVQNVLWSDGQDRSVIKVKPTVSTGYTVKVTDSNGCTASASKQVSVDQKTPDASISMPDGNVISCRNSDVILEAGANGVVDFSCLWSGAGIGSAKQITASVPGTYIAVVKNNVNGCRDTITAEIEADTIRPVFTKKHFGEINCHRPEDTLLVNHSVGNYLYSWQSGETYNNLKVNKGGSYSVTVTDNDNGCTRSVVYSVAENTEPPGTEDFEDILTCEHDTSMVQIKTQAGKDVRVTIEGKETPKNFIITEPSEYIVTHTDVINGCTNTSSIRVTIDTTKISGAVCGPGMFIQSDCKCRVGCSQLKLKDDHLIITDATGNRGYLSIPIVNSFDSNTLTIYNRWGQVVYKKAPYVSTGDEGWRGTYMDTGNPVATGAYYYHLILLPEDKSCRFDGSVTVLR